MTPTVAASRCVGAAGNIVSRVLRAHRASRSMRAPRDVIRGVRDDQVVPRIHEARALVATSATPTSAVPPGLRQTIRDSTNVATIAGTRLHLITPESPLWTSAPEECPFALEPFWALVWPGSWAIARYLSDPAHAHAVKGSRLFDFASGSGLAAFVALRHGAAVAVANEIDPVAGAAMHMNAVLNGVRSVDTPIDDLSAEAGAGDLGQLVVDICDRVGSLQLPLRPNVIVAGDVCYEEDLAARVVPWLLHQADTGATVLLGDPGRAFLPQLERLQCVAQYPLDDEPDPMIKDGSHGLVDGKVWQVLPAM